MNLEEGNLFEFEGDVVCITTNGCVKSNGMAVMGRGVAKQAAILFPEVPKILGMNLAIMGNSPSILIDDIGGKSLREGRTRCLVSFPTKHKVVGYDGTNAVKYMTKNFKKGDIIPGWAAMSDIHLIKESAIKLVELANIHGWERVGFPRPGCENGGLTWEEVQLVLEPIFDDRFFCIYR